ncbi:DUF4142 domain-containing protein [Paracidovorax wautersii]|uniref:Predicted outer membrane protein n=1 Tax=Paracidovorax wautersii TaxID=1177982 RepID=A0A1I2CFN3_9BURK|nr:DUF4142 domain-containing protein [Paracidovorax wautersii]SFE66500.1 Predicted outer membrane protein [Paracidovorax wautersii]
MIRSPDPAPRASRLALAAFRRCAAPLAAAALLWLAPAMGEARKEPGQPLAAHDRAFLDSAARASHAMAQAAQLAMGQARNPPVRAFATQMQSGHRSLIQELGRIATAKSHALPRAPSAAQQARIEALGALPAADFDLRYVEAMGVEAQAVALGTYEAASQGSEDRDVQDFALRTCLRSPRGRAAVWAGWDARRGAQWIARLSTSAATPQTARPHRCPSGWSEIGRLDAPAACMGMSPCGAPEASTHPDCAPTRSPARS